MLMRCRVAEIDVHAITQVLGDKSAKTRCHIGHHLVEGSDPLTHLLGVEVARKGPRDDHSANHDRQLSPLRTSGAGRHRRRWRIAPRFNALGFDRLLRVLTHIASGLHTVGHRGRGNLLASRPSARGLCAAQLSDERLGCRIGLRV